MKTTNDDDNDGDDNNDDNENDGDDDDDDNDDKDDGGNTTVAAPSAQRTVSRKMLSVHSLHCSLGKFRMQELRLVPFPESCRRKQESSSIAMLLPSNASRRPSSCCTSCL